MSAEDHAIELTLPAQADEPVASVTVAPVIVVPEGHHLGYCMKCRASVVFHVDEICAAKNFKTEIVKGQCPSCQASTPARKTTVSCIRSKAVTQEEIDLHDKQIADKKADKKRKREEEKETRKKAKLEIKKQKKAAKKEADKKAKAALAALKPAEESSAPVTEVIA
jgi:hypothetical protein